jgi:hypothetical protein
MQFGIEGNYTSLNIHNRLHHVAEHLRGHLFYPIDRYRAGHYFHITTHSLKIFRLNNQADLTGPAFRNHVIASLATEGGGTKQSLLCELCLKIRGVLPRVRLYFEIRSLLTPHPYLIFNLQ